MATKKSRATPSSRSDEPAKLRMSVASAADALRKQITVGQELLAVSINSAEGLDEHEKRYKHWNDYNNSLLRRMFTTAEEQENYDYYFVGAMFISLDQYGHDVRQEINEHRENVDKRVERLKSLEQRLDLFELDSSVVRPTSQAPASRAKADSNDVFVVHGHNDAIKQAVARMLEKCGLDPIILSEQPNEGRTVIEKFEHNAESAGFAIILMTGDDLGGKTEKNLQKRARQNVILELGYFVGMIGRQRVCALYEDNVEIPSDILGVGYVEIDAAGHWQYALAKELKAAGYSIDMNDL
jgi:predicted nucleotide-binding protein